MLQFIIGPVLTSAAILAAVICLLERKRNGRLPWQSSRKNQLLRAHEKLSRTWWYLEMDCVGKYYLGETVYRNRMEAQLIINGAAGKILSELREMEKAK